MSRYSVFSVVLVMVLATMGAPVIWAETTLESLPTSLRACLNEKDDSKRLECYDREVPRWGAIPPDEIVQKQKEEDFGQPPLEAYSEETLYEITAKVTRVEKRSNKATVWLDNDQVWQQKYSKSFLVKEGDDVRIVKGSVMGGHRMENRGRRIDVKRVK